MSRYYFLILTCLFWFPGSQVEAADTHPASPAHTASAPSAQEVETIFTMADQGDAGSQNYLGFLYATGQTVAKDEKKAFGWFKKAADQGYPEALGNLAMMYEKGLGVAKNLHTALALHRQAAMAGYSISMKRLSSLYESSAIGEERDPIKAEMWKTRYKESLKSSPSATSDAPVQQVTEKTPATELATPKPATPTTNAPPQTSAASAPAVTPAKPAPSPASSKASAATEPYFIQIGGKATARETMEVIQKIVEKNLLPKNKKIELANPDGKSYAINIGPFADAHQAAPYKAKIMALMYAPEPKRTAPAPAEVITATRPVVQAAPAASPPPQPAPAVAHTTEKPITAVPPPRQQPAPVVTAKAQTVAAPAGVSPKPIPATVAPAAPPTAKAEADYTEKTHYVEISGKASALEATKLIQKIVKKGILPKNVHVELINLDSDNCRIRIGPFADAREAAPHIAKINTSTKTASTPPATLADTGLELVPVTSTPKRPVPAAPVAPPQKQVIAPPQPAPLPAITPRIATAPSASNIAPKPAPAPIAPAQETSPPPVARTLLGRYYFVQMNARITFDDSMFLTHFLLMKELVPKTHRVRIENLDGQNFRVSIGPFSDLKEAQQHLQKINQETFQSLSVVTLEKFSQTPGDSGHEPFIQINTKTTLDNATTLINTLMAKKFMMPKMFAEVVYFGNGSYRLRFGPFKGTKEAGQDIQRLKKHLKTSSVLVNLERLEPAGDS